MSAPGWYPDPHRPGAFRWWDGRQWAAPPREYRTSDGMATAVVVAALLIGLTFGAVRYLGAWGEWRSRGCPGVLMPLLHGRPDALEYCGEPAGLGTALGQRFILKGGDPWLSGWSF